MELDWEISMEAELIVKFNTQHVAVGMAKKTKQYEKKIKNLKKAKETECRESHPQKEVQGAVDAPPIKTKHPQTKQTPSQDHHRNLNLDRHKAERASFEDPQGEYPKKQAILTAVRKETGKRKKQRAPKAN